MLAEPGAAPLPPHLFERVALQAQEIAGLAGREVRTIPYALCVIGHGTSFPVWLCPPQSSEDR